MAGKENDKFEVLEKIGQGSFGVIRKVRRKDTGQVLCRKEISYSRMSDKEKEQLYAELKILESLKHPNIVQYCHREHIKSSNDLHLYMEYCGNGDLGGYIKKLKQGNQLADEDFVWTILAQLLCALYRCHYGEDPPAIGEEGAVRSTKPFLSKEGRRVILHRDLKPENVFLSHNNVVKLGDFGLSKIIAAHDFASTYVGTPFYMSPEICAAERYSHHSDVWSLGCIIYELATRSVPFDARSHVELIMKIKNGRFKPLPTMYSQDLTDVITCCLKVDPRARPDVAQLLKLDRIKAARSRLEQFTALEVVRGDLFAVRQDRDALFIKLQASQKQIQDLQAEVARLKEAGSKVESRLSQVDRIVEQHVRESLNHAREEHTREMSVLRDEYEATMELRVQDALKRHYTSLPANQDARPGDSIAAHIRSNTPPPNKGGSSFATEETTASSFESNGSSAVQYDQLDTDLSALSIMEQELGDDVSPLAQRTKPVKQMRQPLGRAKTLASCHSIADALNSPVDVHMADPSPMVSHIRGLSLSPRRDGQNRANVGLRGRNIFSLAAGQRSRPDMNEGISAFADDDFFDEGDEPNSPSRPSSGMSTRSANNGDPFKAIPASKLPPSKRPRPSLGRQQTMPANIQATSVHQRAKSSNFSSRYPSTKSEKENFPPHAVRNDIPIINASPKRIPVTKDGRDLTPSRKAPPPPAKADGLAPNFAPNHVRVKGRTLLDLQQTRLDTSLPKSDLAAVMGGVPKLLPSPAKWDAMDEDMPSPFLARKGRMMVR